ncbi:MAG: hypothetical protein C0434_15970 [Xanthomonadaceae bacterium]|nr:hypothetical protein [Xanthomonadaceae bacterium]
MTSEAESPMNSVPPASRRNNWLIASVALNLFLLGGIASALLFGPHRPPPGMAFGGRLPMHGPGPGGPFAEGLSAAGREQLMALREADEAALGEHLAALRDARQAMDQAFAAEPFDRAAFDAAFARLRDAEAAMSARMAERIAALAAVLSPDDRKAFARGLGRMPIGPGIGGAPPPMPERR